MILDPYGRPVVTPRVIGFAPAPTAKTRDSGERTAPEAPKAATKE